MADGISRLCAALRAVGVDCVFGVPGTQNVLLFEGFRRSNLRTVLASHELAAAFMANGHFRATGRIAALATIPGPGFTYALTGLAEARLDSVGLLYLVGKPATQPGRRFQLQAIDQRAIAAPLLKGCLSLGAGDDVEQVVRDAFAMATSGEPGPVMLELDMAALAGEMPVARSEPHAAHSPVPSEDEVARLAALFARAERPVLLLGQGAFGCADRLGALATVLRIPVVTTPTARGILSEANPLAMGFDPLRGNTAAVNGLLDAADLILGLGCKLGHNGSAGFELRLGADRFVHVDAEPGVAGATYDATLAITARVEEVMSALESRRTETTWPADQLRDTRVGLRRPAGRPTEPVIHGRTSMTAAEFFAWLRAALPSGATVVTDSGMHQILTRRYFEARSARELIVPSDFQSMGFGLPAAIGAKLAVGDRPVVALVGDGGFLMSGMELLTARREDAPLATFVFNDGQLNQIRLQQWAAFGHAHAVQLLNPDYRLLADAFGVSYIRFGDEAPGEIEQALRSAAPVLIEVRVGDSFAMRALPVTTVAKDIARATMGTTVRNWLKRVRRARNR